MVMFAYWLRRHMYVNHHRLQVRFVSVMLYVLLKNVMFLPVKM